MICPLLQDQCRQLKLWHSGWVRQFLVEIFLPEMCLEMFQTKDVTQWTETFRASVDLPDLRLTFAGLFGHLLLLQFDFDTTVAITSPLIGGLDVGVLTEYCYRINYYPDLFGFTDDQKEFFIAHYLPLLDREMEDLTLSVLEKAQLSENTIGTVTKLLYAFLWQEKTIDLGGILVV